MSITPLQRIISGPLTVTADTRINAVNSIISGTYTSAVVVNNYYKIWPQLFKFSNDNNNLPGRETPSTPFNAVPDPSFIWDTQSFNMTGGETRGFAALSQGFSVIRKTCFLVNLVSFADNAHRAQIDLLKMDAAPHIVQSQNLGVLLEDGSMDPLTGWSEKQNIYNWQNVRFYSIPFCITEPGDYKIIISFDVVNYSGPQIAVNPAGISFCADIYCDDTVAYVKTAAELNDALSDSSVSKITFLNDITDGDLTIGKIVTINFNGFAYNGNISFATNQGGRNTIQNGTLNGNLVVNTPSANFTNNALVTGTTTIIAVLPGSFENLGTLVGPATILGTCTFKNSGTIGSIVVQAPGTIIEAPTQGSIASITLNANAQVLVGGTAAVGSITLSAGTAAEIVNETPAHIPISGGGIVSYTVTTTSEFNAALANTIVNQIILDEGIYTGNFVIDRAMTLSGRTTADKCIIEGISDGSDVLSIQYSNVTIEKLTIRNQNRINPNGNLISVHSDTAISNVNVTDCIIGPQYLGGISQASADMMPGGMHGIYIHALTTASNTIAISNNIIKDITGGDAINILSETNLASLAIFNNSISSIRGSAVNISGQIASSSITGNTMYSIGGMYPEDTVNPALIEGKGKYGCGILLLPLNKAGDTTTRDNIAITDNDIYNCTNYGLYIYANASNINPSNNKIHSSRIGLCLSPNLNSDAYSPAPNPAISPNYTISNVTFKENNIYSNNVLNISNLFPEFTLNADHNYFALLETQQIFLTLNGLIMPIPYYLDAARTILSGTKPAKIWVNPNYTKENAGGHIFGYDAFNNIHDALIAAKMYGL